MALSSQILDRLLTRVHERFAGLELDSSSFGARLEQILADLGADCDDIAALEALHIEELALAHACSNGSARALRLLEETCGEQIEQALKRVDTSHALRQDAAQQLRERLFVGTTQSSPRIAQYTGRGPLGRWLQVAATREILNLLRGRGRELVSEEHVLEQAVAPNANQELQYLKGVYRAHFKQAFEQALRRLETRDRLLLRCKLIDDMSIDQIGPLFGVHRATAARWLERVRQTLLADTRSLLTRAIRVDDTELDSIMVLIHSQLDASVQRILMEEPDSR